MRTIEDYVDGDDIDGLLTLVTIEEIALAWHRYEEAPQPKDHHHPDFWSCSLLFGSAVWRRDDLVRPLILELVEHGPEESLGAVAAGVLESFISDDEDDVVWLEAQCATNQRLRLAVSQVWCASWVSEETMDRLDAASGRFLSRPSPGRNWPRELIELHEAELHVREEMRGMGAEWDPATLSDSQRAALEDLINRTQAAKDHGLI
jgi:hypothetical protein